jgi:acetyl esterase/lipase
MTHRHLIAAAILILVLILPELPSSAAATPLELPLWPESKAPDDAAQEKIVERGKDRTDRSISNVTRPTLAVYLPEKQNTGAAVIICPGGGYGSLAIDKEGHDVARRLNAAGIAGIVLKYRMPRPQITGDAAPWPLEDARRALRLVRARAAEWKINPRRIGIMGFSAGGHLASMAGTHFDAGTADATDPVDRLPCRPDFLVLVYPVITLKDPIGHTGSRTNLLGAAPDAKRIEAWSSELHVTPQTPPAFLVHAKDDRVKAENSLLFHEAMKRAGVPAQLQLYETGGHGFGLGIHGGEVATWPDRCIEWIHSR